MTMQHRNHILTAALLIVLATVAVLGVSAFMPASAQSNSGQYNPQTQFKVGANLQVTSIYGLETAPLLFQGRGPGYSQYGGHNQTQRTFVPNQQWNLTYLGSIPTANSSITINVQITNDTQGGGVIWIVQSGSIAYNGTTLTVTGGRGVIGKLDRVLTIGNATDSNGNTYRWSLEGLTTLYGGSVIMSLTGTVAELNENTTMATTTGPNQGFRPLRAVSLTYIATVS